MGTKTTDICDQYSDQLRIAEPIFRDFGGRLEFEGVVSTAKVFEDNALVRKVLEGSGDGRVLVVDGGGSMRCALLGDQLAALAHKNGWGGVVVFGCIRDSSEISRIDLGVKALGVHPLRSQKKGVGEVDGPLFFAGVIFQAGDYVYADRDGLVVAKKRIV